MNTKSLPLGTISAIILSLALASAAPMSASDDLAAPLPPTPTQSQTDLTKRALPFSLQDFVSFLSENFDMQPIEAGSNYAKFIYSERQNGSRDVEIMRIAIQSREAHLQVAFSFKEFNVMHYVAEFMEGPFFTKAESERLYGLLYEPNSQHTWKRVGRFHARATFVGSSEGMDVLFEFAAAASLGHR